MHAQVIVDKFQRWTAISCLALIAVTWRLWTPQTVFPQVPMFAWLCQAPAWLDWFSISWLLAGVVGLAISPSIAARQGRYLESYSLTSILLSLLMLVSLDQHRLQPWAYELGIMCIVWRGFRAPAKRIQWMQWILISIYFYSSFGKLDFEFLHTVGQQMLSALLGLLGLEATQLPASLRLMLATTFPLFELAIAGGLLFPRTRRIAGTLAIAMHLGLIATLGPLGLNHRPGVLVWNIQVAIQVYWLFVVKRELQPAAADAALSDNDSSTGEGLSKAFQVLTQLLLTLVLVLPLSERLGIWDHWASWALYAPHSSRIRVEIAPSAAHRLPPSLRNLLREESDSEHELLLWTPVPIEMWSLQTLDCPIYPQARFQLGVAEFLAHTIGESAPLRATLLGTASRFTGQREQIVLEGLPDISAAGSRFSLNTRFRYERMVPTKTHSTAPEPTPTTQNTPHWGP
jgi:hypothetical protein